MPGHNALQQFADSVRWTLIMDPGDGGAIPLQEAGLCSMTSGGSGQTRTLAAPNEVGNLLILNFQTDGGGDVVVTVADSINGAGATIITFADEGDSVMLIALPRGAARGIQWSVFDGTGGPAFS